MTQLDQPTAAAATETDRLAIDTLRFLAADMVQAAISGHPGMPMGAAPMAWTLWSRHLRHDPAAPDWADRDRFVLSAGHGSALIYGLLHMFGYDLPRVRAARLPPARLAHARAPGVRAHRRRRVHHRTARPGRDDGGRHGARRADAARPLPRDHRPPHLRDRRRRLPDGGRQPRGSVVRRTPRPRPPGRALGRQRHHDRRRRRALLQRRPAGPVRGVRLAHRGRHRRHRRRGDRRGAQPRQGGPAPQLHRGADRHRPGRTRHRGHVQGPRLPAGRGPPGREQAPRRLGLPVLHRARARSARPARRSPRPAPASTRPGMPSFAGFTTAAPERAAQFRRSWERKLPDEPRRGARLAWSATRPAPPASPRRRASTPCAR